MFREFVVGLETSCKGKSIKLVARIRHIDQKLHALKVSSV